MSNPSIPLLAFGARLPSGIGLPNSAGCSAWVSPDLLFVMSGSNGAASFGTTVPINYNLIGSYLWCQSVLLQLAGSPPFVSSNAIELRIGG